MEMPKVDLNKANLTPNEFTLAKGIIATRGPNKGHLRASKPPVKRVDLGKDPADPIGFYHLWDIEGGETAYIWRMVAFSISPHRQHQCMPCAADFDLNGKVQERMARAKELDAIVDKIVGTVPVTQWHGVARWARTGAF